MTYGKNPYGAYQRANETISQIDQVILLYEGAIGFVTQAKDAIHAKDYQERYNLINQAIAIVTGLNSCLNFNERTSDVANALDRYYQSIDMRLLYIQCDDSIESCDAVIEDLKIMRDAWKDAAKEVNDQKILEESKAEASSAAATAATAAAVTGEGQSQDVEVTV